VIEHGTAGLGVEDTTSVGLEGRTVSLDGDGSWALSNGSLELVWVVWLNLSVGLDTNLTFGRDSIALSVSGGVWVSSLELLLVLLEVVISP